MSNNEQDKSRLEAQHGKLTCKFNEFYLAGKERGRESMLVALDKAHEQLTVLGEYSAEQGGMKKYLARDPEHSIYDAKQLGEEAKERLNPSRLCAGALYSLATVLELTGNALNTLSEKTKDKLTYKTGELTAAGT